MHGFFTSLSLLASAAVGALAADLKIDVTQPVECDRRTQSGDKIYVHYHGSLQSNGNKFDASKSISPSLSLPTMDLTGRTADDSLPQATTEARRFPSSSAMAR